MTSLLDEFKVVLHGIWQRRWLAMAVAWGLCLLGWLVIALIPNSYESRARVLVDLNDVVPDATSNPLDQQRRFDQLRQSFASARNLAQVAVVSGMIDRGADERARASAAASLQKATKITATPDNIVEVTVALGGGGRSNAENAALVTRVVESMISVFREEQIRGGAANAEQSIRFIDTQLVEIQTKLTQAESARAGFESRNFGLLPGAGSASNRIDSARMEMSQLESQLAGARSQLAAANAMLASTPSTISIPGMPSVGGGVARQQLASAQAELSGMRARGLTAAHPDVIALNAQIAALRAQAAREPTGGTAGSTSPNPSYAAAQSQRAQAQAQVGALESRRGQLSAEVARVMASRTQEPAIAAEYDRLNRDYTVLKDQYDRLSARREQLRLRGAAESTADAVRIEILDAPSRPTSPAAPNKPLLLVAVLIAGLGGGMAAAFALSQVQTTYPTAARLARASGLPVIGSVTEQLTDALRDARATRLKRFAMAGSGLALLCVILLAVELVQRGTVG